jgi:hypothetical protein
VDRVVITGEPGAPDRRVVFYPSRPKQILMTVGAVVFVLLGVWLVTLGEVFVVVAGVASILFFGMCGVLLARMLLDPRPALVLDRDGLHDRASALAAGLIRWPEISRAATFTYRGQRMLGIDVHDPAALLARVTPVKRYVMRTNVRLVGPLVSIPQNVLPVDVDRVCAEMRTFLVPGP